MQCSFHPSVCAPADVPRIAYSLFSATLALLRFNDGPALRIIDTTPECSALGLVFAFNGGNASSPGSPPVYPAIFQALASISQLPGTVGIWKGAVCQYPMYSSSIHAKTKVQLFAWVARYT